MRSVVVVFPASMWAMMPMFRIFSSGVVRGIAFLYSAKMRGDRVARGRAGLAPPSSGDGASPGCRIPCNGVPDCRSRGTACRARTFSLPPIMGEGAIRLRHPVRVFLLLDRLAFALRGEDHLGGQPLGHRLLAARPAVLNKPPHA